ncbi:protein PCF11-like [Cucumis melo var. makuwa]|uniref:Protein PCF11-like n=2 Tax=Cucumis melo TaxID=3656 RepID=A0A5D3C5R9_CUCMM|nr:protein PCF11-like [Cucumis melo var. makuwa]
MATLHKFKLLASQCAVAGSPTRSPNASPLIHLRRRRRKTLRMLLNRTDRRRFPFQDNSADSQDLDDDDDDDNHNLIPEKNEKEVRARRKLKDLFVSSPPPLEDRLSDRRIEEQEEFVTSANTNAAGIGSPSTTRRSLRPVSATFRYRFLRRAWRPVLVAIPE